MTRTRTLGILLLILVAAAACGGGGGPGQGPPVDPHPVGESVEVGGWYPVDTLLVGMAGIVEKAGDRQSNGWLVTVVSPGSCTLDTVVQGKEAICVGLEIRNDSGTPGGLGLPGDLPVLADSTGEHAVAVDLRLGDMEFIGLGQPPGSVSESTDCTFSAPDDQGRQRGECTAMVAWGTGGGETATGWAAVGAGRMARYDLAFVVAAGRTGWALGWPDGTWFALP